MSSDFQDRWTEIVEPDEWFGSVWDWEWHWLDAVLIIVAFLLGGYLNPFGL